MHWENTLRVSASKKFPCGLVQPPDSLRFGQDALLLAAFGNMILRSCNRSSHPKVAELGSGCGAALLGMALANDTLEGLGIDIAPELVKAAEENADRLGLGKRLRFAVANVREPFHKSPFAGEKAGWHIIMANPPWLEERKGKPCPSPMKEQAITGGKGILQSFCAWANELVCPGGKLCLILSMGMAKQLLEAKNKNTFKAELIIPLKSFASAPAERALVLAGQEQKHAVAWKPPLILHEKLGHHTRLTAASIKFCPWLEKNQNPATSKS